METSANLAGEEHIAEGMGQAAGVGDREGAGLCVTNALIVDYPGIYKADGWHQGWADQRRDGRRGIRM